MPRLARVVTALAAAAAVVVLSGCGAGEPAAGGGTDVRDWPSVVADAQGQTVRWYMWGGSRAINAFVDRTYAPVLKDRYGITLERVPVADTVDAVNQVLSEKQAGADPGSVDLIWINGENFASLRQADMLRTGWSRSLPNARLVDWADPAVSSDFGVPVGGAESPWAAAQFQFIHDPSRTPVGDLPRSYADLARWACANPGSVTYVAPGPGGFIGTRFVKGALYELSGGAGQWATYNRDTWERHAPALWQYLRDLAPCLWRQGATYPRDENQLHGLFANREVALSMTQATAGPATLVKEGAIPTGSAAFVFDAHMIGDYSYVAIPRNAPHPAAALVTANVILDPLLQAAQVRPESGFGLGFAIDPARVTNASARRQLAQAAASRGDGATPIADLTRSRAPEADPRYQDLIEQGWRRNVVGAR